MSNTSVFSAINRPVSSPTHDRELPVGNNPIQLYSMNTPNGAKVSIMLEEMLALGVEQSNYDAHLIDIIKGDQFSRAFHALNPNAKIPVIVDQSQPVPVRVFESGAILLYLAAKFKCFAPPHLKNECLSWLFWQASSAPYLGGGFGHFFHYADEKLQYPIDRYTMEVKRQLHLLDQRLSAERFICGNDYTIADISIWPWYGILVTEGMYGSRDFLGVDSYRHLRRWAEEVMARPAVQSGYRIF